MNQTTWNIYLHNGGGNLFPIERGEAGRPVERGLIRSGGEREFLPKQCPQPLEFHCEVRIAMQCLSGCIALLPMHLL